MSQEEFERPEHEAEFPPKEPREPFLPDEALPEIDEVSTPLLQGLHKIQPPITKEKLAAFLIELRPIVQGIQNLSRADQHKLASRLQDLKNELHAEQFSSEIINIVEKIGAHFNELLVLSAPPDQVGVLSAINDLEKIL